MTSSDRPAENPPTDSHPMNKDEARDVMDQVQRIVAARRQQYPDQPDQPRPIVLVVDEASQIRAQPQLDPDSPAVMLNRFIREWQRARRTEKPLLWREHVTTQTANVSQWGPAEDTEPAEETEPQA